MSRVPRGAVSVLNRLILPAVVPAGQCSDRVRGEIENVSFAPGNEPLIELVDRSQKNSEGERPQKMFFRRPAALLEAARNQPTEDEILAEVRELVPNLDSSGGGPEILDGRCPEYDRGPRQDRDPARDSSRPSSIDDALFDRNRSVSPVQEMGKLASEFGEVKRVISLFPGKL